MKFSRPFLFLASAFLVLAPCATPGAIVYDNTSNFQGSFHPYTEEYGDEIRLEGSERLLTYFAFEYFAAYTPTGDERARLRFYANDGPLSLSGLPTPGTLFYDSGHFSILPDFASVRALDLNIFIEGGGFTWTVEFLGLAENETAGLLYYEPPTVGSSAPFFWQKSGDQWQALAISDTPNNYGARAIAEYSFRSRIQNDNGTAAIKAKAIPGKAYFLQFRSDLADRWITLGAITRATGAEVTLRDPASSEAGIRFYRVVETDTTIQMVGNQLKIESSAVSGARYALERTTNFQTWERLGNDTTATGPSVSFTYTPTPGTLEFFRVVRR